MDSDIDVLTVAARRVARVANSCSLNSEHSLHKLTSQVLHYLKLRRLLSPVSVSTAYFAGCEPGGTSIESGKQFEWPDVSAISLEGYSRFEDRPDAPNWHVWKREDTVTSTPAECFKIYISPTCAAFAEVLSAVVGVTAKLMPPSLKVVASERARGRSDKAVLYLEQSDLGLAVSELELALAEQPAVGVPFTLPISEGRMLSVAIDPKEIAPNSRTYRRHSWRTLVCKLLSGSELSNCGTAKEFWDKLGLPLVESRAKVANDG